MSSYEEEKPKICPNCNKESLIRLYNSISTIIDSSQPKTVGELADKNTEQMVKKGQLPKSALNYNENKKKRKESVEKMNKIQKMDNKQKEKYIMTGKM